MKPTADLVIGRERETWWVEIANEKAEMLLSRFPCAVRTVTDLATTNSLAVAARSAGLTISYQGPVSVIDL